MGSLLYIVRVSVSRTSLSHMDFHRIRFRHIGNSKGISYIYIRKKPFTSIADKGRESAVPPLFVTLGPLTGTKREALPIQNHSDACAAAHSVKSCPSIQASGSKATFRVLASDRLAAGGRSSLSNGVHVLLFVTTFAVIKSITKIIVRKAEFVKIREKIHGIHTVSLLRVFIDVYNVQSTQK